LSKMSLHTSPIFALFFSFFLLLSSTNAFNISKLLGQYPGFTTFNNYLTQTQLADTINSRQTITVLAVDNSAISPLSSHPTDVIKKILSAHVILDYFDVPKLQKLQNKTAILTTLLQSSGQATGQQGFLNVTVLSTGGVAFGSAVAGSNLGSNLVKSVASQPYNISVLQVSNVIIPTGIAGGTNSSTNSSAPPPSSSSSSSSPANTPSKSPTPAVAPTKAPAPSNAKPPAAATPKSSKAPAPSTAPSDASPPSDADAPSDGAEGPSDADAPTTDSPIGSPPMPADAPAAEGPAADAPA
ncbi:Fasciclin domain-containing protein, partial [Cephalotus follicularis]